MFFSNALIFAFFAARRHRRDHAGTVARVLQGRFLRVAVFATFAALVLVGVAGAANSISFTDPAGDSGSGSNAAPDITNVAVSSDASGTITIRVTVANRPTTLQPDDELGVDFDLDQNPDTGSVLYGTEVATVFEGSSPEFLRPDKNNTYFTQVAPPRPTWPASLTVSRPSPSRPPISDCRRPAASTSLRSPTTGPLETRPLTSARSTTSSCRGRRRRR